MVKRTFKCQGHGIGEEPASIWVQFDGATIFNGPIPTISEQNVSSEPMDLPLDQLTDFMKTLFTWQMDLDDVAWEKEMIIEVTSGELVINMINANYNPILKDLTTLAEKQQAFRDSEFLYKNFYYEWSDGLPSTHSLPYSDPKWNVIIDDVDQKINPTAANKHGQQWWRVSTGSIMEFTLRYNLLPVDPEIITE